MTLQACRRGERDWRHNPKTSRETDGGRKHFADSGKDKSDSGAWPVHQGPFSLPRPGEVHGNAKVLSQPATPGGVYIKTEFQTTSMDVNKKYSY